MATATAVDERAGKPRRRSRGRIALVSAHVITAVSWMGADLVLVALGIRSLTGDARFGQGASLQMAVIASGVVAPLSMLALLTGLALCAAAGWRPLRQRWASVSLVLTALLALAANLVLAPVLTEIARRVSAAPPTLRVPDLLGPAAFQLVFGPAVGFVVLAFIVVTMVAKPWGARRSAPRAR